MSRYNTFLLFFIVATVGGIIFMIFYLTQIFTFISHAYENDNIGPFEVFSTILSPVVIVSFIILTISSLVYRILGIVYVARNTNTKDGEKVLWILGFIIFGFITAIVFLAMAKGKGFTTG